MPQSVLSRRARLAGVHGTRPSGLLLVVLAASVVAAIATLVLASNPLPALILLAVPLSLLLAGPELLVVTLLLAGVGVVPYVNANRYVGSIPIWLFCFAAAAGIIVFSWCARRASRREQWPLTGNGLLALVALLLAYTIHRLLSASPGDIPSTTATFLIFPVAALVVYLWLSHAEASENLRRLVPLIGIAVGAWAIAYILASTGACPKCSSYVASYQSNSGLFGPTSRLYTAGGAVIVVSAYVALALLLRRRRSIPIVVLTGLCLTFVVVQAGRAQYLSFIVGAIVLLGWFLRRSKAAGRLFVVLAVGITAYAIVVSPVGHRVVTGYQDLVQGSGTPGYRVSLVHEYDQNWSVFGTGVSSSIIDQGFNTDLGIPNSFLVIGFVGASIELLVLLAAMIRGLRAGSPLGAALAAVFAMVLASRATLPSIEFGPTALLMGLAVGVTAALPVPRAGAMRARRRRAPVRRRPAPHMEAVPEPAPAALVPPA
jgi:hypothetical protein